MEFSVFAQISFVIATVAAVSIIMKLLRQPLIMGYILTGILVGPSVLNIIDAHEAFHVFSEIGIALLLFIIGLGLNAGIIKGLGKVSLTTAGLILAILGSIGYGVSIMLQFPPLTAVIVGIALFFSSTIIILKMLSDKHETSRLYGQIAIGVILLDDIVATMALVFVTMLGSGQGVTLDTFATLGLKAALLGIGLYIAGRYVIPKFGKFLASSQELLFLFSIGWGLAVASLFGIAGLSIEVGALFAGVALAGLPYATEMASKLKPLRDFFIVIFFVTLGETFTFGSLSESLVPALILSALVLIGKPLIIMMSLGILRYTKLTSFKAAIHLSQISEFSIILVVLAASLDVIEQSVVPIITRVALITIGISTYLMQYDDAIYRRVEKYLKYFERKTVTEKKKAGQAYDSILIGYHKGGHEFLKTFRQMKLRYLVIDYDPEIIDHLETQGIRHAYGDATDDEFLLEANVARAKLVVSSIADVEVNRSVLRYLRRHNSKISFICHADTYEEAAELYDHGASYVSLSHYVGSKRISTFIKDHGMTHSDLRVHREHHLSTIGRKVLEITEKKK